MVWSPTQNKFLQVESDMLEQKHISNDRKESTDFEMFVPCDIQPNSLAYVKVYKANSLREVPESTNDIKNNKLSVVGFSQENDVIFEYTNMVQNLT